MGGGDWCFFVCGGNLTVMEINVTIDYTAARRGQEDLPAIATGILATEDLHVRVEESENAPGTFTVRVEGNLRGDSALASRDGATKDLMGRLVRLSQTLHIIRCQGEVRPDKGDSTPCRIGWHSSRTWFSENYRHGTSYPCSRIYYR